MNKKALKIASTNIGAGAFMDSLIRGYSKETWEPILDKLYELNIVGTDAYVLWSDICHKDISRVFIMCLVIPDEQLKDACSRQDYSGRKLLDDYLAEHCVQNPTDPETLPEDAKNLLYLGDIVDGKYIIYSAKVYTEVHKAIEDYSGIANPWSQLSSGETLDELKRQVKITNENISNPEWIKASQEFI